MAVAEAHAAARPARVTPLTGTSSSTAPGKIAIGTCRRFSSIRSVCCSRGRRRWRRCSRACTSSKRQVVAAGEVDAGPRPLGDRAVDRHRGGEAVGVQDRQQVGAPAAHRVAGEVDAVLVDREAGQRVGPHLVDVDLAACRRTTSTAAATGRDRRWPRRFSPRSGTSRDTAPAVCALPPRQCIHHCSGSGAPACDGLGQEDAVVLVDAVEALLRRDLLRRGEDAVVVAGPWRPRLGDAGGQRIEVDVDEEPVDGAVVQRERLLLVEPGADRLGRAEGDVGDGESAVCTEEPGGDGEAQLTGSAEQRPGNRRLDGVRPPGGVGGDGASGQHGHGAGDEVGVPAGGAGEEQGDLGCRGAQPGAETDRALAGGGGVGVGVGVDEHEHAGGGRVGERRRASEERDAVG